MVDWGGKVRLPQRAELATVRTGSFAASAEQTSAAQYTAGLCSTAPVPTKVEIEPNILKTVAYFGTVLLDRSYIFYSSSISHSCADSGVPPSSGVQYNSPGAAKRNPG